MKISLQYYLLKTFQTYITICETLDLLTTCDFFSEDLKEKGQSFWSIFPLKNILLGYSVYYEVYMLYVTDPGWVWPESESDLILNNNKNPNPDPTFKKPFFRSFCWALRTIKDSKPGSDQNTWIQLDLDEQACWQLVFLLQSYLALLLVNTFRSGQVDYIFWDEGSSRFWRWVFLLQSCLALQ